MKFFTSKVKKRIIAISHNLNIRKRILFLYIFVVLIPTTILGILGNRFMLSSLRKDYNLSINEAVEQIAKNVEYRKQAYELMVTRTATDGQLISSISNTYDDMLSQWETMKYINLSFGNVSGYLPAIADFRIYHNNSTLVEDGGLVWKPSQRPLIGHSGETETEWYKSISENKIPMKWELVRENDNNTSDLLLGKPIFFSFDQMVGAVYLRIKSKQAFSDLISNPFHGQGEVYMVKDDGYIFATSNSLYNGKQINKTLLKNVPLTRYMQNVTMTLNNERSIIVSKPISAGWYVIGIVPLNNLEGKSMNSSKWILFITVCMDIFSVMLMVAVIESIVKRVHKLTKKMKLITKGNFNVTVDSYIVDELGELEDGFNKMSTRLGDLMEEISFTKIKEKDEALKALQAQINPHFLYNTLSIIRWKALDMNDNELCQLVDSMTVFYRLALNKGNNSLLIDSELEHVRAYLQIQKLRFPDKFDVIWNIDSSLNGLYTIKLILQPIVENYFMHGMAKSGIKGIINISTYKINNSVCFEIKDNGIGMDDESLDKLNSGNSEGYGIKNIRERLKLYFGKEGKINIESKVGFGSKVIIAIPVCGDPHRLKEILKND